MTASHEVMVEFLTLTGAVGSDFNGNLRCADGNEPALDCEELLVQLPRNRLPAKTSAPKISLIAHLRCVARPDSIFRPRRADNSKPPAARFYQGLFMDGIINCFKPLGLTSARCLDRVRRITGQRKSGHAGTLDPAADGVLLLCMGRGTKQVERLMGLPKEYFATARLDVTSASFDAERPFVPVHVISIPTAADLERAAAALVGDILQTPPAVSALKIGGRPAYKLERSGQTVELEPRRVQVYELRIERFAWPELDFRVRCGRGTYVRALIRDLGAAVGAGGCLTGLRRTAVGNFTADGAWTLEGLEAATPDQYLMPVDAS